MGRVGTVKRRSLYVRIGVPQSTPAVLEELKALLQQHPGVTPVVVRFVSEGGITPLYLDKAYRVSVDAGLVAELEAFLGTGAVEVEGIGPVSP